MCTNDSEETSEVDGRSQRAKRRREARKESIKRAAKAVFAEKGFHKGSISDIISIAGTARGTFYLYYQSKRCIFEDILDDALTQLRQAIRPVDLELATPPIDQLRDSMKRVVNIFAHDPHLLRILLHQAVGLDAGFDEKMSDFFSSIMAMICRSLHRGMEMGLIRPLDPQRTAVFIFGAVKEALATALIGQDVEEMDLDALVNDLVTYNLVGIEQPGSPLRGLIS